MLEKTIKLLIFIISLTIFGLKISTNIQEIKEREEIEIEKNSITYFFNNKEGIPNIKNDSQEIVEYEMIIEIPKINLKKGILSKNDEDNNIDKNVTILRESSYPDEDGNVYIAAHSGNGNHSYFNDIVKLEEKDKVYLYYNENQYIYSVTEIKEINKNDNITISTTTKNNLILITCSQKNKNKYLITTLSKFEEA